DQQTCWIGEVSGEGPADERDRDLRGGRRRGGRGRRGDRTQVGGDDVFDGCGGSALLRGGVAGHPFACELQEQFRDAVVDLRVERRRRLADPLDGGVARGRAAEGGEEIPRQEILEKRGAELPPLVERARLFQRGAGDDVGRVTGALHGLVRRGHLDVERGDL